MAFHHLIDHQKDDKKPEKIAIDAVDAAAGILGNTRAVARSSYVHPHILHVYGSKNFQKYLTYSSAQRKIAGLGRRESELAYFLEKLFEEEFNLLKQSNADGC